MATDTLIIGGFILSGFSAPESVMAGGEQAMVVHKLPGGERKIQTLGPDEADISLSGIMFDQEAHTTCLAIDAMRAAGSPIPLIFGGQYRQVIVSRFIYHVVRFPMYCRWEINLLVASNPALGALGGIVSTIDSLVSGDLSAAMGF
jgi:hypothetical protein